MALGAGMEALRPGRQLLQWSNVLEPGGQSEKSPGKEDDLWIESSNCRSVSVKSCEGLCAIM